VHLLVKIILILILNLYSFLNVRDELFIFLDRKQEKKRWWSKRKSAFCF